MLVESGAIEVRQPHLVGGKCEGTQSRTTPIRPGAAGSIKYIEVLWRPIPAGGSKVARRLVAPGSVERVLHHGQELDVG